jgi:hypothetical protein
MFFKLIRTGVKLTDEMVRGLFRDFISEVRPDLISCDFNYIKAELLRDQEFKSQNELIVPYFLNPDVLLLAKILGLFDFESEGVMNMWGLDLKAFNY